MTLFSTLRHRVYTYLSPARTDRNRTSSTSTTSTLEQRLDRRSMSPATRTKNWLTRNTPSIDSSNSRTPSILGVQGSKITKRGYHGKLTLGPLSEAKCRDVRYWDAPLFNKKAACAIDDHDEDMQDSEEDVKDVEEETVEDDEYDDADDLANDTTLVAADDAADEGANDTTLVAADEDEDEAGKKAPKISQVEQDELGVAVDMEQERAERQAAVMDVEGTDWSDAEIALFQKLNMRGFEPLLPGTWKMDFKTIPEPLFTDKDEEVFIGSTSGHDFRGTHTPAHPISNIPARQS